MEHKKFQPSDINWIKSVKRDHGNQWAYMEYGLGDTFTLNFSKNPKWFPKNYLKAKPGELILLFQRLNGTGLYPSGWYITHLVTPVDDLLSREENTPNHPHVRLVAVIGKNDELVPLDETQWSLFLCNRGQVCNVEKFENKVNNSISRLDKQNYIWSLFKKIDATLIEYININNFVITDELEVEEGGDRSVMKLHKFKEREKSIVLAKKKQARELNKLYCEVCLFDFKSAYLDIGEGFIECHHRLPIALGGIRKTKLDDLALVCSNCHRMLHRKDAMGKYLTISELEAIVNKTKKQY